MTAELKSTSEGSTMVLTISNPTTATRSAPRSTPRASRRSTRRQQPGRAQRRHHRGEGSTFCAGGNLQRCWPTGNRRSVQAESIEGLHNWIDSIRTFPKPVIAAVEGAAAGAGFSLALACDFIVAADDAVFVGSTATWRCRPTAADLEPGAALPRQLVSEWLMCGERIGAPRLHALGVVNQLTETGQALQGALALAAQAQRARAERAGQHQGAAERRARRHAASQLTQRARPLRAQPAPPERRHRHPPSSTSSHRGTSDAPRVAPVTP
jgi:enoyl-CoA hydratase/carnithine racemase